MAARAALQELLVGDLDLQALGFSTVMSTNSVDTPSVPRFIVVRWDPTTPAFGTVGTDRVSIWLHDKDRDYGAINDGLNRIKTLLADVVHYEALDGSIISLAEWLGEGPDLYDGGYETVTRYTDFTVVSR